MAKNYKIADYNKAKKYAKRLIETYPDSDEAKEAGKIFDLP